jgi:hypothetical protein
MNPTSALAFMLAAGALWAHHRAARETSSRGAMARVARALATVVIVVGAATVLRHLGIDLGLDEILFRTRLDGNRIA